MKSLVGKASGIMILLVVIISSFLILKQIEIVRAQTENFTNITPEITFSRKLDCHKCGQHKSPPLTDVNMSIEVSNETGSIADYYPKEWLVVDSNSGSISEYNETYNKIEFNNPSVWYIIRSPERTLPPTKYYFFSEFSEIRSDDWFVIVSDPAWLNVSLQTPDPSTCTSGSPCDWDKYQTYWINATVKCQDGPCGIVNGTARYNDTAINATEGATPFYIIASTATALEEFADFTGGTINITCSPSNSMCLNASDGWKGYSEDTNPSVNLDPFANWTLTKDDINGQPAPSINASTYPNETGTGELWTYKAFQVNPNTPFNLSYNARCRSDNFVTQYLYIYLFEGNVTPCTSDRQTGACSDPNGNTSNKISFDAITCGGIDIWGSWTAQSFINNITDNDTITLAFDLHDCCSDLTMEAEYDNVSYPIAANPISCGNMNQDDTCQLKWLVNTTGNLGEVYRIDVNFSSNDTSISSNDTSDGYVSSQLNSCSNLNVANAVYNLTTNVSSTGTCFNILANNVTLDCQGYTINFSTTASGSGVANSGGYNYTTVKNCRIIQENDSVSISAFSATGMFNGTIQNNTIITAGSGPIPDYSNMIDLSSSSNNTITNNNITTNGFFCRGIYLFTSSNNSLTNNTITTNGYGIYMNSSSKNNNITSNNISSFGDGIVLYSDIDDNTFINNIVTISGTGDGIYFESGIDRNTFINNTITTSGNGYGISMSSASNNSFTGGSIISNLSYDYYLWGSVGTTNNFTDTNFTANRKIYTYNSSAWFNYRNDSTNNIWLKTKIGSGGINRTLVNWNNTLMQWNDTNSTTFLNANYNITGLNANKYYLVYNDTNKVYTLKAVNREINFTILLNGQKNITVQQDETSPTWSNNGTNTTVPKYNTTVLIYTNWSDDSPLDKAILWTNETGGSGINYTDGTYDSPLSFTNNPQWSNFSWRNDSILSGTLISWKIYANDTSSNQNYTEGSFTTWGWSNVTWISPVTGTYNHSQILSLTCRVTDANTSSGISNYNVSFWKNETYNGSNMSVSSGNATLIWNTTSDSLAAYSWKCNISDNATLFYNVSVNESSATLILQDATPPSIIPYVNSVPIGSNASIRADVTDNIAVNGSIAEITYPNASKSNFTMTNISSLTWEYNLTNVEYGDYDVKVFSNDTFNNWNSNTTWFEAYDPILAWFNGTTLDKDNNPVIINFSLYRPNTMTRLYNFSSNASGNYSQQMNKRSYDFNVLVFNNTINLTNVSINTDVGNATAAPISLDNIPPSQILSGTRISKAMYVQTILNYTSATLVLNYTGTTYTSENYLGVYRCGSWAFSSRSCASSWSRISSTIDMSSKALTLTTTNLSGAYAAAEFICGDGSCETTYGESNSVCPTDCPSGGGGGGGFGGGGSGGTTTPPEEVVPISLTTNLIEMTLYPGEYQTFLIGITNNKKVDMNVSLSVEGDIWPYTLFANDEFTVKPKQTEEANIKFFTMPNTLPGVYNGNIIIKAGNTTNRISVILRVEYKREKLLDVKVEAITKDVYPGDKLKYFVTLYNLGLTKRVDVLINYTVKSVENETIIARSSETVAIENSLSFDRTTLIPNNTEPGVYMIEAVASYEDKEASSVSSFNVVKPFWMIPLLVSLFSSWMFYLILFILLPALYLSKKLYERFRMKMIYRARYVKPVDITKLPQKGLYVGKVSETNVNAYLNPDDLTTHLIVAGGTGSGKSVSAMVIAEELLKRGFPVVVFDPTAQWTGFIRPCTDNRMLSLYKKFGLKKEDSRPFKGTIIQITDPFMKVEMEKFIKKGEITILLLNKLSPDQLDYFVRKTIDYMFTISWPESRELKLLMVYDEVHRLLPKYAKRKMSSLEGGGYIALERGVREFRKWGIGLVMISQVLLDFKGAIRAVIATETQMRTKYEGDINRIRTKYGWQYSSSIPKLEIGTGLVQNPSYNNGKPWFISFRPLLHDTFRISDSELETYDKFRNEIEEMRKKVVELKSKKIDTYDMELEINLADEKTKIGQLKMAETYIESARSRIEAIEKRRK